MSESRTRFRDLSYPFVVGKGLQALLLPLCLVAHRKEVAKQAGPAVNITENCAQS